VAETNPLDELMLKIPSATLRPFETKINEFQMAMDKYNQNSIYPNIRLAVSFLIVFFQIFTGIQCFQSLTSINPIILLMSFFIAYFLTDFINGVIHMYMDNNTQYRGFFGPFIAAFHFHHFSPRYSDTPILKIYFLESGTKFWLVVYLIILVAIQSTITLPPPISFCLFCIGVLSSVAEVSHFLCHNSKSNQGFISILQKHGILLSKKHHFIHHSADNKNYAFLNGISDPLINIIASYFYRGYKNHSDQHARVYNTRLKRKKSDHLHSIV
jgi:sterol desaturase/sphingolipid hydroxylase (fatty acid hydroxylase superfamily)